MPGLGLSGVQSNDALVGMSTKNTIYDYGFAA